MAHMALRTPGATARCIPDFCPERRYHRPAMPKAEFEVVTAEHAADVLGLKRDSVLDLVNRRAANGYPVSWGARENGNPVPVVLILAAYVKEQARNREGELVAIEPMRVVLEVLPGLEQSTTGLSGEQQSRLAETQGLNAILEAENRELRLSEVTRQRDEALGEVVRLRGAIAQLVGAPEPVTSAH